MLRRVPWYAVGDRLDQAVDWFGDVGEGSASSPSAATTPFVFIKLPAMPMPFSFCALAAAPRGGLRGGLPRPTIDDLLSDPLLASPASPTTPDFGDLSSAAAAAVDMATEGPARGLIKAHNLCMAAERWQRGPKRPSHTVTDDLRTRAHPPII